MLELLSLGAATRQLGLLLPTPVSNALQKGATLPFLLREKQTAEPYRRTLTLFGSECLNCKKGKMFVLL